MAGVPRWFWPAARMVVGSVAIGIAIVSCSANHGSGSGSGASAQSHVAAAQAAVRADEATQSQTAVAVGTTVVGGAAAAPGQGAAAAPSTVPHGSGPLAVASVAADSDGCNHDYGTSGECVPLVAPGGGPMNCAELTELGFFKTPLLVSIDSLGLMTKPNVKMGLAADGEHMTVSGCTDK
jgi:hypothetical protein